LLWVEDPQALGVLLDGLLVLLVFEEFVALGLELQRFVDLLLEYLD